MTDGWLRRLCWLEAFCADTFNAKNTSPDSPSKRRACRSGSIRSGSQGKAYPGFDAYLPTATADSVLRGQEGQPWLETPLPTVGYVVSSCWVDHGGLLSIVIRR